MEEIKPGYTRVSTILKMLPKHSRNKENRQDEWSYPFDNIDQEMLANKARIGSNVHAAINAHSKGEYYPLVDDERGYFDSFLSWEKSIDLHVVDSEMRLYDNALKITGAVDMIASLQGSNDLRMIDFKCTYSEDKDKWPIQGAFYHYLCGQNSIAVTRDLLFVKLNKEGKSPVVYQYDAYQYSTMQTVCLEMYKYLTRND